MILLVRLSSAEAFLVTEAHCLAKHVGRVPIYFVVSAAAIVAILRSGVGILPALQAELVLAQVLQIPLLKTQLSNTTLLLEYLSSLLIKPPLLLLLITILRQTLLLNHLLLALSILRESRLVLLRLTLL